MVGELDRQQREPLSRSELATRARRLVTAYSRRVMEPLYEAVRNGEGKQSIGSVPGRTESQLAIDGLGQNALINLLVEEQFPAYILGEHSPRNVMEFGPPQMIIAQDPFDNSKQYKKGQDTTPYSVLSIYGLNGRPLAGVVCDTKEQKSYIGFGGTNYVFDNLKPNEFRQIYPSSQTTIKDAETSIAVYLGEDPYRKLFIKNFTELSDDMKGILYTGGGAYIYALLARGAVDAYVMFQEPNSEILPGLALALYAGCTVISVNPDGTYTDFRFNPELINNPEEYSHGNVPLFIAATTPELAEEIIGYYLRANHIDAQPRKIKNGSPSTTLSNEI